MNPRPILARASQALPSVPGTICQTERYTLRDAHDRAYLRRNIDEHVIGLDKARLLDAKRGVKAVIDRWLCRADENRELNYILDRIWREVAPGDPAPAPPPAPPSPFEELGEMPSCWMSHAYRGLRAAAERLQRLEATFPSAVEQAAVRRCRAEIERDAVAWLCQGMPSPSQRDAALGSAAP